MKKVIVLFILVLIAISVLNNVAKGGDFASAFQTAIKAYPPSTNIAGMGGIWAGLPNPYSSNPAAFPRIKDYDFKNAVYGSYNLINFSQGPDINLWSGTGLASLGPGVLRIDYCDFNSEKARAKNGLETGIEGRNLQLGYGFPLNRNLSFGATLLPIYSSETSFHSSGILLAGGKSDIEFGGRAGLLYKPFEKLYLGVVYEYNKNELKSTVFNPFSLSYIKSTEHPITHLVRPGIAIQPWKGGTIGADYLWGSIDNKKSKDDYRINQWFFGGEQWLTPNLALRSGLADGSLTAGIGLKWRNILFDYAYISRSIKDMEPYFGHSSSHFFSLTIAF